MKGCQAQEIELLESPEWWFRHRVTSTSLTMDIDGENMGKRW